MKVLSYHGSVREEGVPDVENLEAASSSGSYWKSTRMEFFRKEFQKY